MIVLKILVGVLLYFICAWITMIIMMYIDRTEYHCNANEVYKDYRSYATGSICLWWICLPVCIIHLLIAMSKKWSIAITETLVARKDKK